ncbi:DUF4402 domain-containing protein [Bdellovibrio bacteriovorus]|uniref:DUF4402 domain-containing protein n=1 Tax=Bdellovibrio TaxID=958 RepID=UPI0035A9A76F
MLRHILVFLILFFSANGVFAIQGTAKSKVKVVNSIQIHKLSDLIFSEAGAGSTAETIPADVVETPKNASFEVSGEASRAIAVTLPADGTIKMTTGGSGPDNEIAVNGFMSNNPTTIDANGQLDLFVGATREALTSTQALGDYEANFTVDVVYQ